MLVVIAGAALLSSKFFLRRGLLLGSLEAAAEQSGGCSTSSGELNPEATSCRPVGMGAEGAEGWLTPPQPHKSSAIVSSVRTTFTFLPFKTHQNPNTLMFVGSSKHHSTSAKLLRSTVTI